MQVITDQYIHYWVMKGNPLRYDWDQYLRCGREENWHSRRIPKELSTGDRVFFWESGTKCRIIALGIITKPAFKKDSDGRQICRVRYLTERLTWMPGIDLLRAKTALRGASFLKAGAYGTIYPLTAHQGTILYQVAIAGNPNTNVWPDQSGLTPLPDIDVVGREGDPKLVMHVRRERDRALVEKKKQRFRELHGKLYCEGCDLDFSNYGLMADGLFEVHHRRQLSRSPKPVLTKLSDLAVLCSNCHRVIHRTNPMISVEALSKKLRHRQRHDSSWA